MIWRTRDANAHSCHVFPLFFLSTLNHKTFRPFRSLLRVLWQWKYCVDFPPSLFLPRISSSSSPIVIRLYPFIPVSTLSVYVAFIYWIYIDICSKVWWWRWSRRAIDEMHKGFYVRRCEMCMNGYMVFFFIINIFLLFLSLGDRVWDRIKIKCTEWIDK